MVRIWTIQMIYTSLVQFLIHTLDERFFLLETEHGF